MIKSQSEESASESNYPFQRGKRFLHCKTCMAEKPPNVSPAEYGRYNIGFTEYGIEIWCMRHEHIVGFFNLYDIWSTVDLLKDIQGVPAMPVVEVDKETLDGPLIYTGIEGVFVDPFAYGNGGLLQRLCSKYGMVHPSEDATNDDTIDLRNSLVDADDLSNPNKHTRRKRLH